jgi:short-subunit dehydrogenase
MKKEKKVIVITGASSGIGEKLYKKFESDNHIVINLSRSQSYNNTAIICDVSNLENVTQAFDEIKRIYGKVDLLINNAGYGLSSATELINQKEANAIFDTNFFGTLYCFQNAVKLMPRGARIVNISSATALFPLPYRSLYCASKAAVSSLSQSIRMELAPAGIDVVSICPGDTKTPFTKNRVKNFETNARYENRVESATQKLDLRTDKRMSADYVANVIYKICKKRKTKPQYIVGFKYKVFYLFQRLLPIRLFNKILESLFNS